MKPRKPRKRAKSGQKTLSQLLKEADRLFSLHVRQSRANGEGMVVCFTCGKSFHWKKIHNGHYLSRYYKSTRWDEDNCRPQCMMDNLWKRGDPIVFRENLVKEIGEERVKAVEAARHKLVRLDRAFLEGIIEKYRVSN